MIVEVLDVLHLEGIEEDNLVYGLVKAVTSNDYKMYLARLKGELP